MEHQYSLDIKGRTTKRRACCLISNRHDWSVLHVNLVRSSQDIDWARKGQTPLLQPPVEKHLVRFSTDFSPDYQLPGLCGANRVLASLRGKAIRVTLYLKFAA